MIWQRTLWMALGALLGAAAAQAQSATDYAVRSAQEIAARRYVSKQISSGQNRPALPLGARQRAGLLVALRAGIPEAIAAEALGLTSQQLRAELDTLTRVGFLQRTANGYRVTVTVITAADAARYFPVPDELVGATAQLIKSALPSVRELYAQMPSFHGIPFEESSLLILSDVLLDNWQINAVEDQVLKAPRPQRVGGRYYISIEEAVPWSGTEAFGIYGNQFNNFGAVAAGVYGNRRGVNDILSLPLDSLRRRFGVPGPDTTFAYRRMIVSALVAAVRDSGRAAPRVLAKGLESFGLARQGKVIVPVLTRADYDKLGDVAAVIRPALITLLEQHRPFLTRVYNASPYAQEISFEEYFIWWYHFYYSAVTDHLVAAGDIRIPAAGVATYLVVW